MKCGCPKGAPKTTTPSGLWADSDRLSTPLRWGLRLLLPQRCLHNRVGIGHSCSRSVSSQHAMRSLPVSTIGVPTHDAQLRSAPVVRPGKCRLGRPSDILWAARSLERQQVLTCVVPRRRAAGSGGRLVLPLPLEEWCGRPPHHPPRCAVKVARRTEPQKEGVCLLPPCTVDLRASCEITLEWLRFPLDVTKIRVSRTRAVGLFNQSVQGNMTSVRSNINMC